MSDTPQARAYAADLSVSGVPVERRRELNAGFGRERAAPIAARPAVRNGAIRAAG